MPMNENIIPIDDEYKSKLFNWFYKNLNESFKTAEIEEQLKYAYDFAFVAHREQRRKTTKEPFIVHPVSVALIVANEIGLGVISVVAALLHDVVEDTHYTLETISERFGSDVADIVAGLTKITNVYNAKSNVQAETFKKMLLSIPHDPRVVFIKLADRLHNMRTMEGMPQGTIQIKAGENLYVYVPVAYQLGLYDIKNELEDSSFKYAQPQQYESVVREVNALRKIKDPITLAFKKELMQILVKTRLTCKIVTEKKSYFYVSQGLSVGTPIEDISYEAVRVVFQESDIGSRENTVGEYFKLYSSIIVNFPEREGYRSDYVVKPKKNGFQALVFQVNYHGHWIEVQIITEDNDMVSHKGYSPRRPNRTGITTLVEAALPRQNHHVAELRIKFNGLYITDVQLSGGVYFNALTKCIPQHRRIGGDDCRDAVLLRQIHKAAHSRQILVKHHCIDGKVRPDAMLLARRNDIVQILLGEIDR